MVDLMILKDAILTIGNNVLDLILSIPSLFVLILTWIGFFLPNIFLWIVVFEIFVLIFSFNKSDEDDALLSFFNFNYGLFLGIIFIIRFAIDMGTQIYDAIVPG